MLIEIKTLIDTETKDCCFKVIVDGKQIVDKSETSDETAKAFYDLAVKENLHHAGCVTGTPPQCSGDCKCKGKK